ncbi:DUF1648 domain-containing protein [Rossellomorea aquimaris]|uniref:DUF1648 domain-containing protein n=1 Tax=Rossellomorea aquimaris TaxID=189382 RepID=UPI001CD40AA6|nr:DUF1648 domain-containing protein [Rossellomorea aquimaris]MCA1054101.1 DUF1648 domain-containing protein [Rossellomorea aquimaris]
MENMILKRILTIASTSIFLYHVYAMLHLWSDIPPRIAIHFSDGEPDEWGTKHVLFIMPIVSILFWLLLQKVSSKPEIFNYIHLTEENKKIQYSRAEKVLLLVQNLGFMALIFANEAFLGSAAGMETSFPFSIAIILLGICFIAPICLFVWALTLKH